MEKLLGKKVLLFSPFGTCKHYTDGCVTELESRGAEVRVYDERPSQASFTKIYMYLFKKVVPQYFFNYIRRIVTMHISGGLNKHTSRTTGWIKKFLFASCFRFNNLNHILND